MSRFSAPSSSYFYWRHVQTRIATRHFLFIPEDPLCHHGPTIRYPRIHAVSMFTMVTQEEGTLWKSSKYLLRMKFQVNWHTKNFSKEMLLCTLSFIIQCPPALTPPSSGQLQTGGWDVCKQLVIFNTGTLQCRRGVADRCGKVWRRREALSAWVGHVIN